MNFKNMPELQWEYGYFTVIGVILCVRRAVLAISARGMVVTQRVFKTAGSLRKA